MLTHKGLGGVEVYGSAVCGMSGLLKMVGGRHECKNRTPAGIFRGFRVYIGVAGDQVTRVSRFGAGAPLR